MMNLDVERRDFLKLAGIGSAVLASGLWKNVVFAKADDFVFLQISDTHWGFDNPKANPDFADTLKKEVSSINGLKVQPDFIIFTGDLTHTTDDDQERRRRLTEFRGIVAGLKNQNVKFMPGEHDASLDNGKAYKEVIGGETHYTFDHKGVHFIVLDNVSDPGAKLGQAQLDWLAADLKKLDKTAPIVVFTHRPLFDLMPDWDWNTRDGAQAVELLTPFSNVIVFYGHIHQENHHMTGHIAHHSCKGSMYPLPAPGSVPVKAPVPWDPAAPWRGLGFRNISRSGAKYDLTEYSVKGEIL
jgi:predicted phosphodiesterase